MKKLIEKIEKMNEAGKFHQGTFSGYVVNEAKKNNDIELLKIIIENNRCDYSRCPICGKIFCNICWTKTMCESCIFDSQEGYLKEYNQYEKIKEAYAGTRLYGAFRKAGLSVKRAKELGF